MLKLTAVVSLMLIGSTLWAAGLSCDSCGSECASACGTRHFRSCCFNYLRRKRAPLIGVKLWPRSSDTKDSHADQQIPRSPVFLMENVPNFPEPWQTNLVPDYKPARTLDYEEDRLQEIFN